MSYSLLPKDVLGDKNNEESISLSTVSGHWVWGRREMRIQGSLVRVSLLIFRARWLLCPTDSRVGIIFL